MGKNPTSGWIKDGKRGGVALVLIIRKTDFHAYYTNDFIIFDVSAGAGSTGKPGGRL